MHGQDVRSSQCMDRTSEVLNEGVLTQYIMAADEGKISTNLQITKEID